MCLLPEASNPVRIGIHDFLLAFDLRLINYAETDPESGKPWSSKKLCKAYEEGARRCGRRNRPKSGTRDRYWRIGCGIADCSKGQARFH
jgi:xanthine dehydrogenase YagR molybdenum-binding subunit